MKDLIVIPRAQDVASEQVAGRRVAVIDVLRATTVVVTALERGARAVAPVAEVEEARALHAALGDSVLAGERGGFAPSGFDYGNSPLEFAGADLAGRLVLLTTTNGTLAVRRCEGAAGLLAACLRNASSVAEALCAAATPVALVCAGTEGRFGIEDFYCAGLIAARLAEAGWSLDDLAWAAAMLAARRPEEAVNERTCAHVRTLLGRGLAADVPYCLEVDRTRAVPRYEPAAGQGVPGVFVLGTGVPRSDGRL